MDFVVIRLKMLNAFPPVHAGTAKAVNQDYGRLFGASVLLRVDVKGSKLGCGGCRKGSSVVEGDQEEEEELHHRYTSGLH